MPGKALIVFEKNEAEDIGSWISWHLSIGFDTIIIYDDHSTDGTWELINNAAPIADIRCLRAEPALRFNHRQRDTYSHAMRTFGPEFDWMMFLDADEYLDIGESDTLDDFLSRYEGAAAIAINWRCFGSAGHIVKPPTSNVFEAYNYHSGDDYEANRIVKSLFRPSRTEPVYLNPHRAKTNGPYVNSRNEPVLWNAHHPERTETLTGHHPARILHFAIRSVEHYVEKVHRRSDIRDSRSALDLFLEFNRNDHFYRPSARRLKAMSDWLRRFQKKANESLGQNGRFAVLYARQDMDIPLETFHLTTHHGTTLCLDTRTGEVCHAILASENARDTKDLRPITGIRLKDAPHIVYLYSGAPADALHIRHDPRLSSVLPYLLSEGEHGLVGLRSPFSNRSICFLPPHPEGHGTQDADRNFIDAWESITLHASPAVTPADLATIAITIANTNQTGLTLSTRNDLEWDSFFAALSAWSREKLDEWARQRTITLPPWLQNRPQLVL